MWFFSGKLRDRGLIYVAGFDKISYEGDILKKCFLLSILALGALAASVAQTAAELETLLNTDAVTYAQAARFVLQAAESADTEAAGAAAIANPEQAFQFAQENDWLPKGASPDTPARLDGISLLFMRSFGLKGGLLYSLFKNPHYAYREMVYRQAIQGRVDPQMAVSGYQLIFITNRILESNE